MFFELLLVGASTSRLNALASNEIDHNAIWEMRVSSVRCAVFFSPTGETEGRHGDENARIRRQLISGPRLCFSLFLFPWRSNQLPHSLEMVSFLLPKENKTEKTRPKNKKS